jgi:hypothetical protein
MDIGKSFTFVFEDDAWITKILIAAAILFLGVLFSWLLLIPLIVATALLNGYMVEIIRRVARGQQDGLPEWDNWGDLIAEGLKVLVIQIVYMLPIIIASFCLIIPAAAAENAEGLSVFLTFVLSCFMVLWAILATVVLPAATAIYAATDDLAAAFRFGEVFALVRDNLSTYLITLVMSWVAGFVGSLGSVACGVGSFFTYPYATMVIGHLYGQAYAASAAAPAQDAFEEEIE